MDEKVKLWHPNGPRLPPETSSYGTINLAKLGQEDWEFPFNWVTLKLGDINEVFHLLELIGDPMFRVDANHNNKAMIQHRKDDIRKKFLLKIARYNRDRILSKRVKKRKYSFEEIYKERRKKLK